jgi:flagellar protein FliO/FliZ
MSLIASRGAALLAPLPEEVRLTAIDDASLAMLAPAEPEGVSAHATSATAPIEARQPGARASDAKVAPPIAVPVAVQSTQSATTAPVAPAKTSFAEKTTTTAQIGKPTAMPQPPAAAGSIGSAVLALVMVIGLILALAWLAKRMPGLRGGSASSALRVVGSLALSPRERLVVVAVGNTQLVLGVGAGGTRTLHTLSEPLPVTETAGTPVFAQLLSQHFGKKA